MEQNKLNNTDYEKIGSKNSSLQDDKINLSFDKSKVCNEDLKQLSAFNSIILSYMKINRLLRD